jgi:hypothetical protein
MTNLGLDTSQWLNSGYLPRVTIRDGRALEEALAGRSLWSPDAVPLSAAVVEASYLVTDRPLIRRLRDAGVELLAVLGRITTPAREMVL